MLVRVLSSDLNALPRFFDEHKHRQTRDLDYEDWEEFMVVWRMDRIELYENYVGICLFCLSLMPISFRLSQEKSGLEVTKTSHISFPSSLVEPGFRSIRSSTSPSA